MIMSVASSFLRSRAADAVAARPGVRAPLARGLVASTDPVDDDDLGDEEDLAVSQPLSDEESNFDDFDDEFDDDFEEEENDPDWDHPDEGESPPPPAKGPGGKK